MPFVVSHFKLECIFKQFCLQKTVPSRGSGGFSETPIFKKKIIKTPPSAIFHHEFVLLEAGLWPWEVACGSGVLGSSEPWTAGASGSGITPSWAATSMSRLFSIFFIKPVAPEGYLALMLMLQRLLIVSCF